MKYLYFVLILGLLSFLTSCSKDRICPRSEKAELRNLTGFDGCEWMIFLNDGTKLEPVNLRDFDIDLSEGKKIWIDYHLFSGGSICMVGKIVKIDCISER